MNIAVMLTITIPFLIPAICSAQTPPQLTVGELKGALNDNLPRQEAEDLAGRVRMWFGADNLKNGASPKVDGLSAAWAVEAAGTADLPEVTLTRRISNTALAPKLRKSNHRLQRIGETDVFAVVESFGEGEAVLWSLGAGGKELKKGNLELYSYPPDTVAHEGVPVGKLTQQPKWQSRVFEGTERDWWVYVPAQYKPESPACVMVFQDGGSYKNYVPAAFDNLIHKGEMPITVGIFVNPGTFAGGRSNRSFEYDTLSDQYARFLLDEILPEVEKTIKLRHDPASRAIAGISSGGICSWTAAWERPNEFSKVLSWVGSFTDIAAGKTLREGGHNYPALIRKMPNKPIRVFLQDGDNDLDNEHGSWPLANRAMAKSLAFKGYDYKFVYGKGFHSDRHGRALLPDSLRWLWRDYKAQ